MDDGCIRGPLVGYSGMHLVQNATRLVLHVCIKLDLLSCFTNRASRFVHIIRDY